MTSGYGFEVFGPFATPVPDAAAAATATEATATRSDAIRNMPASPSLERFSGSEYAYPRGPVLTPSTPRERIRGDPAAAAVPEHDPPARDRIHDGVHSRSFARAVARREWAGRRFVSPARRSRRG